MNNPTIRRQPEAEQAMTTDPTAEGIHSLSYFRRWALLSQRELGQKAGVQASTIYFIESGRTREPRLLVMRKICQALGVPAERIKEFREALGIDVKVGRS